ncbi:hypothetical protein [Testudinibacter aquarius]|uniref:Colicin import membrane protein n=1 Tax=Testudinibacter aquarius TaxID=1524974 RepID=A0A4R3Y800_9PAST|nr:hypothetical protein [Testudinibacter aquarius]KAE9530184.1 hypothetical protein A1D24_06870 [Testudinibacter aquarius]TCV87970.1 hypothetical protein EDC16_104160 [Testudinibacter aquarius]TNG88182.1 hypothetical protein FHQ21_11495 [Testudinibacter aquarius]
MKPTIKTTALAILISLGAVACGSSGGSSSNKSTTNTTDQTQTEQSSEQLAAAKKQAELAQQQKTAAEKQLAIAQQAAKDAQNAQTKAESDKAAQVKAAEEKVKQAEAQVAAAQQQKTVAEEKALQIAQQLQQAQSAVKASELKIQQTTAEIQKIKTDYQLADAEKNKQLAQLEKQLTQEKAALTESEKNLATANQQLQALKSETESNKQTLANLQKSITELNKQITELRETNINPITGYAMDSRIRVFDKNGKRISGEEEQKLLNLSLDYLLQPATNTDERLRKFLFAPATSGILPQPNDSRLNSYTVKQTVDGKAVDMVYTTYRYSENDAYLAEISASGAIDGQEIRSSTLLYGGQGTPAERLSDYQKLDVKKTYDVKAAPGLERWLDSYDITLIADFGKATVSGQGIKKDDNPITAPGNITFTDNPIYSKDGIIQFGGDGYVEVEFTGINGGYQGKDQLVYPGMMIGADAEKIVGRIGGSTMIGHEKK